MNQEPVMFILKVYKVLFNMLLVLAKSRRLFDVEFVLTC